MVVRAGIHAELRQVAVAVALYGGGLAVGQHVQAVGHRIQIPLKQMVANRLVDGISAHGVHRQTVCIDRRHVVEEEVHPQCVVIGEESRIQIGRIRRFQMLVLVIRHTRTRRHRHCVVTHMGHSVPGPPFVVELDALEIVSHQIGFHQVAVVVVVEGVELVHHHVLNVGRVAQLCVAVVADQLQGVVAVDDTALVEHHRTHGGRTVAVALEGVGLRRLLTLTLRPYLHLNLVLGDGRHDVGIVIGGKHLRVVQRGVCGALDAGHADVERPVALALVQSQDDVLVVAGVVDLLVETHRVLRSRVAEDLLEGIHLSAVVLNAVVYLLPLELADVSPRV